MTPTQNTLKVRQLAREGKSINFIVDNTGFTRTQVGNILIAYIIEGESPKGKKLSVHEEKSSDVNTRELTLKYSGKKKTLESLLAELDVDTEIWEVSSVTYNEWDAMRPNDQGTIKLHQLKVSFKRKKLISNFEIPAPVNVNVRVREYAESKVKENNIKTAVILPDMQVGFKRNTLTGELTTLHDRQAMDVALQIARYVRPDRIVLLGDNLDLPQESKYPTGPEFYFTTQAAAVELAWWLAQLRSINPKMEIDYIAGNHDIRAEKSLMMNAVAAYGLKAADDLNGPALLSIPRLLGLEGLAIKYHPNYPSGKVVLNENLICIHGEVAKSESGATVSAVVKDTRVSVIQGHIHRYEVATKTLWGADDKPHMYTAASFGCLCKIDPGAVPGSKAYQNWQQGLGIVYYEDTGLQMFRQEFIPIIEGRAILQSEIFQASHPSDIGEAIEFDTNYKGLADAR